MSDAAEIAANDQLQAAITEAKSLAKRLVSKDWVGYCGIDETLPPPPFTKWMERWEERLARILTDDAYVRPCKHTTTWPMPLVSPLCDPSMLFCGDCWDRYGQFFMANEILKDTAVCDFCDTPLFRVATISHVTRREFIYVGLSCRLCAEPEEDAS